MWPESKWQKSVKNKSKKLIRNGGRKGSQKINLAARKKREKREREKEREKGITKSPKKNKPSR